MKCADCGKEKTIFWYLNNYHEIDNKKGLCKDCYFKPGSKIIKW